MIKEIKLIERSMLQLPKVLERSFGSTSKKYGRSASSFSSLRPTSFRVFTTSSNRTLFPNGVKCNPSLQKPNYMPIFPVNLESFFMTMIWKKNILDMYLKVDFRQSGISCIFDHVSMTGLLSSLATALHAFANSPAASFVLSVFPDGSSPQRSLSFRKHKLKCM